jgi:PhoH-like ATPase
MPPATKQKKIFVLDTSVLLYDSEAVKNFHQHDIAIPITVLEELDSFKKGSNVINLHAREFTRYLDKISDKNMLQNWIPLNGQSHGKLRVLQDEDSSTDAQKVFGNKKNDHRILNATLKLMEDEQDKKVVLVSKDINLRIKARSLNITAEDYETVRVSNIDELYKGSTEIKFDDAGVIDSFYENGRLDPESVSENTPTSNHFYILKNHSSSALGFYNATSGDIEPVHQQQAYGVNPRNAEQTFALQAIMNSDNLLVTITGAAGTGKTLLALAGALEQRHQFRQIYLARPIVPLSNRDLGYLPGDVDSKIDPYMQPLWDNLSFIKNQYGKTSKQYNKIEELVENQKLRIIPLAYIRGRSLSNIIFIVDEAQNLTPHEIKTIITRAGEDTKIIFTGDIYQIDTPYLDTQSNGLSYLVDRMQGNDFYAHINLQKGERSELANIASKLL